MKINAFSKRFSQTLTALLVLIGLSLPGFAQQADNRLFSTTGLSGGTTYDQPAEPYIKRSRSVTLNTKALNAANPSIGASGEEAATGVRTPKAPVPAQPLLLNLFPDVELPVTITSLQGNASGGLTWTGKVDGQDMSLVILVVRDGNMTGNITVGMAQYQIRPVGNSVHVVHEINQAGYPSERDPDRVDYPPAEPSGDNSNLPTDENGALDAAGAAMDSSALDGRETKRVIDVLVVYTTAARIAQGGSANMQSLIDLAVAETNTGYNNSGINQQLNLVHTEEVSYAESGNIQTDRDRLKAPADGFMDNVHTLRNTYSADVVSLIVANGGGYCGMAYIMDPVSTQFEDSAFCVVEDGCATGYYSFGHELGHLMAARHDWYVDWTDNSPYTYNHGLTNPTAHWRTIMAYNDACIDAGTSCTRLPYWSDPDLTYGGAPMGVREGAVQPADNRKTLANTGFVVANFRVKQSLATPSAEFDPGAAPNTYIPSGGIMFDVKAKKDTVIHGFASVFYSIATVPRVEIYYMEGTYSGHSTDPSAWKLAGSANNVPAKAGLAQTHLPIDLDITIPAGQTYAFYIAAPNGNITYRNDSSTSEGALFASDDTLELSVGRMVGYPFTGGTYPRIFSGTIYHSFANKISDLAITPGHGSAYPGIMFDVKAKQQITIHSFSPDLYDSDGIIGKMEIYYREGSHVGHETTTGDWTLLRSVDNVNASNNALFLGPYTRNRIPLDLDFTIPAGKTYGFYVTVGIDDLDSRVYYNSSTGTPGVTISAENNHLQILAGAGLRYPFYGKLSPRSFAGTVYYTAPAFPWPMFLPGITKKH